jgi:hypothetical protein
MMVRIEDMRKIECPFKRVLQPNGDYIVTPEINPEYEWVFTDETVLAIEKLHGTNVSILIQDGIITSAWNRTERIPFFNKGKKFIIEGLLNSFERGYMEFLPDGQHFGELLGPKVNGNPYKLKEHLWIPFSTVCQNHLRYKSWGKYPKDFNTISEWFKDLMPLYALLSGSGTQIQLPDGTKTGKYDGFVEGIVFTHPDGRMAKLRRDMFDWFKGNRHKEDIDNV